jgi:hypothetical protein
LIKQIIFFLFFVFCIFVQLQSAAQQATTSNEKKLTPARYEINAKRMDINYNSKEALTSSREFKKLDPTYYVGWLYEGAYSYTIAADELGYRNAIAPLQKAISLMEKEFGTELKTRTKDIMTLIKILPLHRDYDFLNSALYESFEYSKQTQAAWNQVRHYQRYDLQDENNLEAYNMLSWMVHRNRFFTSATYPFLKNNIGDNEKYAQQLLDSGIKKINRDNVLNNEFFSTFQQNKLTGVYHYKSVLYSYALNIESAEYYFNEMKKNGYFPENNYANFCATQAKFKQAEDNYILAGKNEPSDKRLREFVYFQSILDVYKAKPKESIRRLRDFIAANGTTPGFGWYQLALSRSLLNDGQYGQAMAFAKKAEAFHEVHIGTTLGQTHYDFTTNVLQLMSKEQQLASITFENKKWYFNASCIWQKIVNSIDKFLLQYVIINQFSNNPERDDVIYKLFSTESTVSVDEVWALVKDYSTQFFIAKFSKQLLAEKRPFVKKYYQLFLAKLYIKESEYDKANGLLNEILVDKNFDAEYEKQFMFRVLEAKLNIVQHDKNNIDAEILINKMYHIYPQWMPYNTNAKVKMKLVFTNNINNTDAQQLKNKLLDANINWVETADVNTNTVYVTLANQNKLDIVKYRVINNEGTEVVTENTTNFNNSDEAGNQIVYGIFNIGSLIRQENVGEDVKS